MLLHKKKGLVTITNSLLLHCICILHGCVQPYWKSADQWAAFLRSHGCRARGCTNHERGRRTCPMGDAARSGRRQLIKYGFKWGRELYIYFVGGENDEARRDSVINGAILPKQHVSKSFESLNTGFPWLKAPPFSIGSKRTTLGGGTAFYPMRSN